MSDDIQDADLVEASFDLDEDIFDFASVDEGRLGQPAEDVDLDEIFASLEEEAEDPLEVEEEAAVDTVEEPEAKAPDLSVFENMGVDDASAAAETDDELIGIDAQPEEPEEPVQAPEAAAALEEEPSAIEAEPQPVAAATPAPAPASPAPQPKAARPAPVAAAQPQPVAAVAAPAQPTTIRVERDTTGLRSLTFMILAITTVNSLVALVTVKSTTQMRESVWDGVREVAQTAHEIRDNTYEQAEAFSQQILPIVTPDAGHHPTFELAAQDIEEQRYVDARRRLYALLAIIDRLDEVERAEVEAKANYMIAQTKHLEAIQGGISE